MVNAQGRNSGYQRFGNDIGAIICASNAYFQYSCVYLWDVDRRLSNSEWLDLRLSIGTHGAQPKLQIESTSASLVLWLLSSIGADEKMRRLRRCGLLQTSSFVSSLSHTSKKYFAKFSSDMGIPLTRMRSRTATICGEVYRPSRYIKSWREKKIANEIPIFQFGLADIKIELIKAHVDPLPFVPVTCITFSLFRSSVCTVVSVV